MKKDRSSENIKSSRVLYLYRKLIAGGVIFPEKEAERAGVVKRTIMRDMDEINDFLQNCDKDGSKSGKIVFDRKLKGYKLISEENGYFSNGEILAVCKILLESRAFRRDDILSLIEKIINNCTPAQEKKMIGAIVSNEFYHYIEPIHKKHFTDILWDIYGAVNEHKVINILYEKSAGSVSEITVFPAGITFSGYYFYLTAITNDKDGGNDIFPLLYRIDRIKSCDILGKTFTVPYKDRFEESEFRKRIQFMCGGKLRKIKFLYKGEDPEPVLDRIPTADICEKRRDGFVITAEVFGDGIDMWIRSQGDKVCILRV